MWNRTITVHMALLLASACLFVQVELLSVTQGCFYWVCHFVNVGGPITVAAGPTRDTWHTGLTGRLLLWHCLSALCPSNGCMRTHIGTDAERMTHTRRIMSCTQIDMCAVACRIRQTHRHTLPEDYKHHFVGHQETCCFAFACAWPVTTTFAVNILSL